MKLSVESKVGMAVASIFTALAVGVMAQGQSGGQTGGPNNYGPTNNPGVTTHMSDQGYDSSLPGRTNAEENREKFSDQNEPTAPRHAKKNKNLKSKRHHQERTQSNQRAEELNESGD
jgi:hypothetical protein